MSLPTLSLSAFSNDPFASLPPIFPLLNIPDDYCPLTRQLSFGDFDTFILPDGTKAYCLKQSAGVALWWTLSSIAADINTAGISPIRYDHSYPTAIRSYVPDSLFHRINMERPEVLKVVEIDSFNPLYHLTTIPNTVAFWKQLQQVGLAGLAWIKEAKARCQYLGPSCGWDWGFHQTQLIDTPGTLYLNQPVIDSNNALGLQLTYNPHDSNIFPATPPNSLHSFTASDNDSNHATPSTDHNEVNSALVLHPIYSHYANAYPAYDVFSKTTLIDNGYIDVEMEDITSSSEAGSICSESSGNSSFSDCHSCHSLPLSPTNDPTDFYYTPLPIVVEDNTMDIDSNDDEATTATDLAAMMFPILRTDIVNA